LEGKNKQESSSDLNNFWLIIIIAISVYFFTKGTINYMSNDIQKQTKGATIGAVILILGLLSTSLYFFQNMVREYAVTNKRVIIKSGIIGTDYKSIHFDQIQSVDIEVGMIGKIFGVGDIKIDTGKTETYSSGGGNVGRVQYNNIKTRIMYDVLKHIINPYEVYQILQKNSTSRKESLYSGRADKESNPEYYK